MNKNIPILIYTGCSIERLLVIRKNAERVSNDAIPFNNFI